MKFPRQLFRTLPSVAALVLGVTGLQAQDVKLAPEQTGEPLAIRPAEKREYKPASVGTVRDFVNIPQDFWVHATLGDTVLKNDLSMFVFGQIQKGAPKREDNKLEIRHGGLIDAVPSVRAPENFQYFGPNTGGNAGYRLRPTSISSKTEANGKASVTVEAEDVNFPALKARTEYLLYNDMPGVLVTTTLTNTSDKEVAKDVVPSDFVLWGAMIPFIPGQGWTVGEASANSVDFIFARRQDVWMLIAPETGTMNVTQAGEYSALSYGPTTSMEPGETRLFRRWFLVTHQDPAYLYAKVLERRADQNYGTVVGRLIERQETADGQMIEKGGVGNSDVFIAPMNVVGWTETQRKDFFSKPYLIARTRPSGTFNALLLPGDYRIVPAPDARLAPSPNYAATIEKGKVQPLDFGVSPASRLVYQIVDAATKERIPGKLTIEALRGTPDVELGYPGNVIAGNVVYSSHGANFIDLPAGTYRVTASRGPEFNTAEARVVIRELKDTEQTFELTRAFETPGWISADVGVRTDATANCRVNAETRVVSAIGEGVEWLVSGDTATATDLEPAVAQLGLSQWLRTSPGYRHSGEQSPFRGDFLLFPLDACSTGAKPDIEPIRKASSSREILQAMRKTCPDGVILLSRGSFPGIGYLMMNGYDPAKGMIPDGPDGGYSTDFDAYQIWEGKRQPAAQDEYLTYQRMLAKGMRVTPFANTNSHSTWLQEVGYPRVYIQSGTDDPKKIDPAEMARNIKQGKVLVTNGPFVTLNANSTPVPCQIADKDGEVELDVAIYAANWVQVSSISVNVNGLFTRRILLNARTSEAKGGRLFPSQASPDEGKLRVRVTEDSIIDLVVEGSSELPMDPVNPFFTLARDLKMPRGQYPMAITAAASIDFDGDGKVTPKSKVVMPAPENVEESKDPAF